MSSHEVLQPAEAIQAIDRQINSIQSRREFNETVIPIASLVAIIMIASAALLVNRRLESFEALAITAPVYIAITVLTAGVIRGMRLTREETILDMERSALRRTLSRPASLQGSLPR